MKPREQVLAELIRENSYINIVEVGVKSGRVFGHLLKHCPNIHIWGIDLWMKRAVDGTAGEESYNTWNMGALEAKVHSIASMYPGRAVVIKEDSAKSASMFADGSIDLVFIDADHTEASVLRDIDAWWPKIKLGGTLCGHDVAWKSVRNAVESRFPAAFTILHDSIWCKKKT